MERPEAFASKRTLQSEGPERPVALALLEAGDLGRGRAVEFKVGPDIGHVAKFGEEAEFPPEEVRAAA